MNKKSVLWSVMSLLILASLVLAACAPAATEAPAEEPAATEAAATEAAATEAAAEESSLPEGDGKVEIFGGYGEAQAAAFQQALTEFGEANGIEVTFTSLASFDTDINVKIEAGQEPDIAMWPQPGGL